MGTEAIVGIGVTNLTMNVYIAFFLALGIGTTAVVARNIGAGDKINANHAVKQSFIMSIVIGLLFGIINLLFSNQILLLLGAEDRVMEYALPYFITVAVPTYFYVSIWFYPALLEGLVILGTNANCFIGECY